MTITEIDLSQEACDARLLEELIFLTKYPERWQQSTWGYTTASPSDWECGTVACLAGHGAVHAGLAEPDFGDLAGLSDAVYIEINAAGIALMQRNAPEGWFNSDPASDFTTLGAVLFGLPAHEAAELFDLGNTLGELWYLAARFTDGRVSMPEELAAKVAEIDSERASGDYL